MSQIESTRRACRAMSTQSFTSHSLKRLKLLAIMGSVLILWGGFISSSFAATKWALSGNRNFVPFSGYIYSTNTEAALAECSIYTANRQAYLGQTTYTYTCNGLVRNTTYLYTVVRLSDGGTFGYETAALLSRSIDDVDSCSPPTNYFNPATGLCDPNYTPPPPSIPPEKNLGGCSERPSPYVSNGSE